MAFASPQVVVASATQTTTGVSSAIGISDAGNQLNILANVTAISGTPNMVLTLEWSMDGVTFAPADGAADAITALTAVSALVKSFEVKAPFYRVRWTITGGSPSLTFAISAYVTP